MATTATPTPEQVRDHLCRVMAAYAAADPQVVRLVDKMLPIVLNDRAPESQRWAAYNAMADGLAKGDG